MRVFKDMGILDDFLAVSEDRNTMPLLSFVRGAYPHDEILKVSSSLLPLHAVISDYN